MPSLFRLDPAAKITSLFREVFSEIAVANQEASMQVAIEAAAQVCGMEDYDVEAIAERLADLAEKAQKAVAAAKGPKAPYKQSGGFGVSYSKWVGGQTPERLCLWLSDFDPVRARTLYCDTDIDLLSAMIDVKTEHEWQLLRTQFEGAVVSAGGKLEGQADATVHEVDMSDTSSVDSMIQAMQKMGF